MTILGIDEVGRGPWAGPLVIGAVILEDPESEDWQGLNDSKKLTAKKREQLSQKILESASATGLGWVSAAELDELGLSESLKLATRRAVSKIPREKFTEIIIDGTINFLKGTDLENLVTVLPKADAKIKAVSAASIIAKVARDNYMIKLAEAYPGYGFEKHVGYGTALHKAALEKLGPCPEHRKSFKPVAKIVAGETSSAAGGVAGGTPSAGGLQANAMGESATTGPATFTTSAIGKKGEDVVASYLKQNGHKILARNYKTKFYEIDIISATKDHIYFTEVKYRKNSKHGQPLEFIDKKKQQQMGFAATAFMKYLSKKLDRSLESMPPFSLAAAAVEGNDFELKQWFEID